MPSSPYFSKTARQLCSATLDLPPCCLEFVPHAWGRGAWFVVGTYGLKKNENKGDPTQPRHGTLNLYNIMEEEDGTAKLNLVQNIPYPAGIYDLHFLPDTPTFAIATTTGSISIFRILQHLDNQLSIEHINTHQVFEETTIITSFAWYPISKNDCGNEALRNRPLLAASSSSGTISLVRFQDWLCLQCDIVSEEIEMPVHERYGSLQYAYCCAWSGSVLFSGGDDSYLRMVRLEGLNDEVSSISHSGKFEPHAAGVLAILPIPESMITPMDKVPQNKRHVLITGGYDDYIRVYSIDGAFKSAVLAELYIGHGVYRLKFLDDRWTSRNTGVARLRVLASCTNAGVRILEFLRDENCRKEGEWSIKVLASVTQHRSLCYASDTPPLTPLDMEIDGNEISQSKYHKTTVVSTSMYDKLLCIWTFEELDCVEEADGISELRTEGDLILSETIL